MKGYRINPDKEYALRIIEGVYRKNGSCPCRVVSDETTLCPCDEFTQKGICKCNLFIPVEEK